MIPESPILFIIGYDLSNYLKSDFEVKICSKIAEVAPRKIIQNSSGVFLHPFFLIETIIILLPKPLISNVAS